MEFSQVQSNYVPVSARRPYEQVGKRILDNARLMKSSMGARALVKHARSRVSDAVLKLDPKTCRNADLHLSAGPGGMIRIEPKR